MTLSFDIRGQELIARENNISVISDTLNYLRASFTFSAEWSGLIKTAIFKTQTGVPYSQLIVNGSCLVPHEVIKPKHMKVSVYGLTSDGTTRITSTEQIVFLSKSGYVEGATPSLDPSPNVYQQIVALMSTQAVDAQKAESAEANARALAQQVTDDKQTVLEYKQSVETSKQTLEIEGAAKVSEATEQANRAEREANEAAENANIAANNILNGVSTHNNDEASHFDIRENADRIESIARGRATSLAFDTVEQLDAWIAGTYERTDGKTIADLLVGDNLYIRDLNVPDYWWDGTQKQVLEAEAPALADYYTKLQVEMLLPLVITRSDHDALYASGQIQADRLYDIIEETVL